MKQHPFFATIKIAGISPEEEDNDDTLRLEQDPLVEFETEISIWRCSCGNICIDAAAFSGVRKYSEEELREFLVYHQDEIVPGEVSDALLWLKTGK